VYERKTQNRPQILSRLASLRGDEPWAGYDELTADEVIAVLSEGDDDRTEKVRSYEHAHKNRAAVLHAAARALTDARPRLRSDLEGPGSRRAPRRPPLSGDQFRPLPPGRQGGAERPLERTARFTRKRHSRRFQQSRGPVGIRRGDSS
jgi:hypothetical protein